MTINAFAAGTFRFDRQSASLIGMKGQLDTLARQLSTGRTAETYGGLGAGRTTSLSAHAAMSAQDGYLAAIGSAETRVKVASASLTQLKSLAKSTQTNLANVITSRNEALPQNSVQLATNNLSAAVDALNQQVGGVYVFSGRATDTVPVLSNQAILNGIPSEGLDGLRTLIAEQKAADLGPKGNGRLTQTLAGSSLSLSEDANGEARANFGFSLKAATSSGSGALTAGLAAGTKPDVTLSFAEQPAEGSQVRVVVELADGSQKTLDLTARTGEEAGRPGAFLIGATKEETALNLKAALGGDIASVQSANPPGLTAAFTSGTPATVSCSVDRLPAAGDTITLKLGMHDGTTKTITLTAGLTAEAGSTTTFAISDEPGAAGIAKTAANLDATLERALRLAADTDLSASSTTRASLDFFDGSPVAGLSPRRVSADGNGYAESASTKTVIWYKGDTSADPRGTAAVQVGTSRTVEIGAQANEEAIRRSLAGIAAVAAEHFGGAATDGGRFQALADRTMTLFTEREGTGSLEDIGTDFGLAASSMANAKSVASATRATLEASLDGIDTVSTEEVAAKLLSLQTQLQASYKVTSILSELSLVNFLR